MIVDPSTKRHFAVGPPGFTGMDQPPTFDVERTRRSFRSDLQTPIVEDYAFKVTTAAFALWF